MKAYIGKKLVLDEPRSATVLRIMERLNLLEEEYLPYNIETRLPVTPDYRVSADGEIAFLPVLQARK